MDGGVGTDEYRGRSNLMPAYFLILQGHEHDNHVQQMVVNERNTHGFYLKATLHSPSARW